MRRCPRLLIIFAVALAFPFAGCGSEDGSTSTQSTTEVDVSTEPKIEVPSSPAPERLVSEDIVGGSGGVAEPALLAGLRDPIDKAGSFVKVKYVGVDYETGEEFDSSWDRGIPFGFELGAGQVIRGWDQKIAGMKVGGRREIIIPPDLAFGSERVPPTRPDGGPGTGSAIGPDATLIYVVDLLAVR